MIIKRHLTIALLCILLSALMVSCGSDTDKNSDAAVSTDTGELSPVNTETLQPEVVETSPDTEAPDEGADESLRTPIDNEDALEIIQFQYAKATEAIDLIKNSTLSADLGTEIIEENGDIYFPVNDTTPRAELDGEPIATFSDLSKYIKAIFARSIADDLISEARKTYKDVNGVLCKQASFIDTEPGIDGDEENNEPTIISTEFFLSKFTDSLFRYTAKVTYEAYSPTSDAEDETENAPEASETIKYFDFIFENTGSGWFWTAFPEIN